jgi:hypothetical protein
MPTGPVLTDRTLNRTLLHRQLLDERRRVLPLDVVAALVGLQAQEPRNPYVALWSRIERFDPSSLESLLLDHLVVRTVVMRGTVHLVTADDCWTLRPLVQPVLDRELTVHQEHKGPLSTFDMTDVRAAARRWLADAPRTMRDLRALIAEAFPDAPAAAAAYALRNQLTLVQLPPRGLWSTSGQVRYTTAETWLGEPPDRTAPLDDVVRRYLAAFGPATSADVGAWSRLTGMREVLERMRPSLRTFRDDRGRELFDLPDAPIAEPEVALPVRFLPEYDNVLLSHADRSRVIPCDLHIAGTDRLGLGAFLVDGYHAGVWTAAAEDDTATITLELGRQLTKRQIASTEAEARRLLRLLHPDRQVREVRTVERPA